MEIGILTGLFNNAALLLAMFAVYELLPLKGDRIKSWLRKILTGAIVGIIGVAVMLNPWKLSPGVYFDARSVLLSVSGLFFGPVPTMVAMIMAAVFRLHIGGAGAGMGVCSIAASGAIGIAWKFLRRKSLENIRLSELYTFGVIVNLVVLSFAVMLPRPLFAVSLARVAPPMMIMFPFITAFLGRLMSGRLKRRRAEDALRESEERWLFAIEGSSDGVWDRNIRTGEVFYSRRWKEILGYVDDEIGAGCDEWMTRVHGEDLPRVREELDRHLRGETDRYAVEYRMQCKDGSYVWILARGKVISRDGEGNPLRFVGTITDISERKSLEAQLYQSQKMEAVGRLAGGVAHDFNNILTAIVGFTHLLSGKMNEGDPAREYCGQILRCTERAEELIRGLLAFSRRRAMEPKAFDLNDVVMQLEKMLGRLIGRTIELVVETVPDTLIVLADPGNIEQVILNLVTNAVDAMPEGGTLSISTSSLTRTTRFPHAHGFGDPGRYACVTVRDTGLGIDPETMKKIFEPFFTTKEVGKGTGLGLSIVYGIVKHHNGCISVSSEPGKGTSFRIYLPLARAKADIQPRIDDNAHPSKKTGT